MSTSGNRTAPTLVPSKKLKKTRMTTTNSTAQSTPGTKAAKADRSSKPSKDEFDVVKEYLLKCPHVSSVGDSFAIKAAIEGIEKEQKRQIRDAKLRSKFAAGTKAKSSIESYSLVDGEEIVVVEEHEIDVSVVARNPALVTANGSGDSNNIDIQDDDMDWHDSFSMEQGEDLDGNTSCCYLGKTLAKTCIDAIAEQQQRSPVLVSTPLAAIAVAIHAALRSDVLGFACTGVPEDQTKGRGSSGFAPPVRELPKTEFLPRAWDNRGTGMTQQGANDSPLPLRYRKMDTGAVVLKVEGVPSSGDEKVTTDWAKFECQVTFVPSNGKEDSTHCLKFPLPEHINLDSWNAAVAKAGKHSKIPPSLHYKNLSGLLSKFCRAFDLGAVDSNAIVDDCETTKPDTKVMRTAKPDTNSNPKQTIQIPVKVAETKTAPAATRKEAFLVPSTLNEAFPDAAAAAGRNQNPMNPIPLMGYYNPHCGDFPDDLLPASTGFQDPRFGRIGGRVSGSGNLMGPNHPIFSQNGSHPLGGPPGGFASGGPGTMQPRYDPIVPPGIAGSGDIPPHGPVPGRRPNNLRRKIPGEPNPDHLPPPNSLGDDMFM
mmetsp:Transcript_663/g.1585  ORF Transcript_663/g.1585 Transcript_663/m.1585 type:complete len:594 (+) Transcript_663:272-2053(+)